MRNYYPLEGTSDIDINKNANYNSVSGVSQANILQKEKEENAMSYALVVFLENEVYIVSDSRSTIIGANGEKQSFCDNCQKIVIIPDTNIVVASTGLNIFDGDSLRDIVYSLQTKNQYEIFKKLFIKFKQYELFEPYIPTFLFCATVKEHIGPIIYRTIYDNIGQTTYQKTENNLSCYSSGTKYANSITEKINMEEIKNNPIEKISSLMKNVISIGNITDNSIGSPIQMVHITPEKAEWVEGFKSDFVI